MCHVMYSMTYITEVTHLMWLLIFFGHAFLANHI